MAEDDTPPAFVDADPISAPVAAPDERQALVVAPWLSVATHDTTASVARAVAPLLGQWHSDPRHPIYEWATEARRAKTGEQYARVARRFALWLARERGKLDPLLADHADLRDYLASLAEAGYKSSTQALHASALSALYGYLVRRDVLRANPMASVKRPRADADADVAIDVFTTEELYALLAQIPRDGSLRALRDRALFVLLFRNGLRVSEAVGSRVGHLTTLQGERVLQLRETGGASDQHIKGGRGRDVVLKRETAADLDAYLAKRGLEAGAVVGDPAWREWPLFSHTRGPLAQSNPRALSRVQVWRLIRHYGLAAGIAPAKLHPHMARHTALSTLAGRGVSVFRLKEFSGHATTRHLEKYVHAADRITNNAAKEIPY